MSTETPAREVLSEGMTGDQILELPKESVQQLVLLNEPIVFRVGSATILGRFNIAGQHLVMELAQIEGGGEGILPALASLARRFAALNKLTAVEWIVHAVSCAKPNLKLRRVLDLRGFKVEQLAGVGVAYHLLDSLED